MLQVRWVHVDEPADIARLLNWGEFLPAAGIGPPDGPWQVVEWVGHASPSTWRCSAPVSSPT
ncbi:MAG TPA: hypothetical protein VIM76_06120 [Candidatus Dormibacteraeota bacterium]